MTETSFCLLIHNPCSRTHVLRALFAWRKIKDFSAFYFNELMRNDISIELLLLFLLLRRKEYVRRGWVSLLETEFQRSPCVLSNLFSLRVRFCCVVALGCLREWYTKNNCSMSYC
ncbi:hypothetical protein CDAR_118331 [Caerostris darwini]|uniref:Maturase K n=1 Tax=Caerostris darwini TaxID=1538125 RepID=A0AAV4WN30_9ARAC|nr:hypothetical protein CDAR_118331 [Caerostris darwini]